MKRALILSATLLALAACSTHDNLLAPDNEDKIVSPDKRDAEKGRAVDPVCGMPLENRHSVWHASYQGAEYSFDSESCKRQFVENPELYTATVR